VINQAAAAAPPPNLGGSSGAATFNFEGESLQAVVKAILGDMLGQNYVIAPGVQGTVTLATPKPVSPAQAMSLLEQVLSWNNARMVYADGATTSSPPTARWPAPVAPRTGSPALARGYEAPRGAAALHRRGRNEEGADSRTRGRTPSSPPTTHATSSRSAARAPNSRTTCGRSRSSTSTG
jgi:type II secretory pathway component GspD/PulD (secretin)